jgi:hypothetical protein
MIEERLKKLTEQEYNWYFSDYLNSLVRKTFCKEDGLLFFVRYQPDYREYDHKIIQETTKELFGRFKYVEVIEQTFERRVLFGDGDYVNAFHSHVIMKESDYITIEDELIESGIDVEPKPVWGLQKLTGYLRKQAGMRPHRILPIQNIPVKPIEKNEDKKVAQEKEKKSITTKILTVVKSALKNTWNSIKQIIGMPFGGFLKESTYTDDS